MPEQFTELCIQVLPSPERGRDRERGEREGRENGGGEEKESILKSCQVFFCLHFFIFFLRLMETSEMSVLDMLIFFLHSFHMKERHSYAFGENKKIAFLVAQSSHEYAV